MTNEEKLFIMMEEAYQKCTECNESSEKDHYIPSLGDLCECPCCGAINTVVVER